MELENKKVNFDYNFLDDQISGFLIEKENKMRDIVGKVQTEIGKELYETQQKLASHNKYEGIFEKWYTYLGMKKDHVYRSINRFHVFANCENKELFEEIPMSLSYEISKPSVDPELKQKVLDGDIKTHKEYKQLQKEKEQIEEELQREKLAKQALIDSAQSFQNYTPTINTVEIIKDVTPKHVEEELTKLKESLSTEKTDNRILEQKVIDLGIKKDELDKKLKQVEDYEKTEQAEINKLKQQKEKLELQAHISINNLQIGIHSFIEKYSPSVFLQGAVASSTFMMKDDLLDSVIALEEFTRTLRDILDSKIVKKTDFIELEKIN